MNNKKYKNELLDRLLRFAVRIIVLGGKLPKTPAGFAVANQIVKAGTSIGANCEEAQDAFSRKDFLKTMNISLKEAKETCYWLKAIKLSRLLPESLVDFELKECNEIIAILTSSVKTIKEEDNSQLSTLNFQLSTFNSQLKGGFTLVELLVVVAVIAIVLAVVFPNFMGARQRARDTQRKSDLSQIQKALELYKLDQNPPVYPTTGAFGVSLCNQCWSSGENCTENIYMRKFPCDPGGSGVTNYIYTRNDLLSYQLTACLENIVDPDRDSTPSDSCTSTGVSYTVNEP